MQPLFALYGMAGDAPVARQRSFIDQRTGRPVRLDVIERAALKTAQRITGPAAIVENDTTTIVPAGWRATRNTRGDLLLDKVTG